MLSGRLLIVSNRLPVTARLSGGKVRLASASGGLATGLRPWHEGSDGLWIGWPGDVSRFATEQRAELTRQLAERAIVPVYLSKDMVDGYYHGFSNRVLWPLFHYLIDRVPVDASGWGDYCRVNELFADVVAREYRAGDTIWVHDYQLMVLPRLLRERLPGARIGFFLHIPFPSSEVFRVLPRSSEILKGLLGADLLGFHTFAYLRHFASSLLHVDGVEADLDRVRIAERHVKLGVFPMGIDSASFATLGADADVVAEAESIRREAAGRQVVLGVDRLDYTKGIPQRIQAVERLLARDPTMGERFRYVQLAVPSREEVETYQSFRRQVEERISRINGAHASVRATPIHYMHRSVPMRELVGLYRAADVMLVTPLRDGMNLVAKEFVASRADDDGVLVLSEFAGAAAELDGAVLVNPYDVDAIAESLQQALSMPAVERRARMKAMRRRVAAYDIEAWARSFLGELSAAHPVDRRARPSQLEDRLVKSLASGDRTALRVLLDYDGTLVPIVQSPELAQPDAEVLELLERLAASCGVAIDIVSGRPRETLEAWLGHLPVALWAEHGFWHRPRHHREWEASATLDLEVMDRVLPILEQFTASTPGSRIERKSTTVAWHFRQAQREFGAMQARELRMLLGEVLSTQAWEVLEGKQVVEVRPRGVTKGLVAQHVLAEAGPDTLVLAVGDDRTDEDLFRALPPRSLTVAVGSLPASARFRVGDYRDVRRVLRTILAPERDGALPRGPRPVDGAA